MSDELLNEEETSEENSGSESGSTTETPPASTSIINLVVESVMALINALEPFSEITRGALGTKDSLCCEVAPSSPDEVYMDKNQYINLDLTLNGKNRNLQTLSDTMNTIHETLTMKKEYPSGNDWKIVDIGTITEPQVIGRDSSNAWMMASSLSVKIYTDKSDTPAGND